MSYIELTFIRTSVGCTHICFAFTSALNHHRHAVTANPPAHPTTTKKSGIGCPKTATTQNAIKLHSNTPFQRRTYFSPPEGGGRHLPSKHRARHATHPAPAFDRVRTEAMFCIIFIFTATAVMCTWILVCTVFGILPILLSVFALLLSLLIGRYPDLTSRSTPTSLFPITTRALRFYRDTTWAIYSLIYSDRNAPTHAATLYVRVGTFSSWFRLFL